MKKTPATQDPTRNVWLQPGFLDAEGHLLKSELLRRLDKAIRGPESNRMSGYATAMSSLSAAAFTRCAGRSFTCRMRLPAPSRRLAGSSSIAPEKKPTFT
jgi:hypothetical protein